MKANKKNIVTIVTAVLALVLAVVTISGITMPTVTRDEDPVAEGRNEYTYEDGSTTKRFVEVVKKNTNKANEITVVKSGVDNAMTGKTVHTNSYGTIDVTHANEGYVALTLTKSTDKKVLACVDYTDAEGNKTRCSNYMEKDKTYNIPMYMGSGKYTVIIEENIAGDRYSIKLSVDITVKVNSELDAFLASTRYADYADAPKTVAKAAELTKNCKNDIEKINVVYNWVLDNIEYKNGHHQHIPGLGGLQGAIYDLDYILEDGKGACGEISAVIAGMLRAQNIPCKVVQTPGHAYVAVWKETGTETKDGVVYATGSWVGLQSTYKTSKVSTAPDDLKHYG